MTLNIEEYETYGIVQYFILNPLKILYVSFIDYLFSVLVYVLSSLIASHPFPKLPFSIPYGLLYSFQLICIYCDFVSLMYLCLLFQNEAHTKYIQVTSLGSFLDLFSWHLVAFIVTLNLRH